MTAPCSPTCFVAALELLRVEVGYNNLALDNEDGFERLLRCQGLDVLAGDWVGARAEEGLDPWRLVDSLTAAVAPLVAAHEVVEERTRAELLLALSPALRTIASVKHVSALGGLLDAVREHWAGSPIGQLALAALFVACSIDEDGRLVPEQANVEVRELVRDAFDYGGLPAVQAVVERLRAHLGEGEKP